MITKTNEISDGIFRFSTCLPVTPDRFTFNQFLVKAEEPLLFHTGPRALFPLIFRSGGESDTDRKASMDHIRPCGGRRMRLNEPVACSSPELPEVAHGGTGVMVSLNDLADRPPRALRDGEIIDLGGKRVRHIDTTHVPHGWEARVLFEETTRTLLCGDLFTHSGDGPAITAEDIVEPASRAEELFRASCLTPTTGPTIRKLAELSPTTLALMHGSSFNGNAVQALHDLGDVFDGLFREASGTR